MAEFFSHLFKHSLGEEQFFKVFNVIHLETGIFHLKKGGGEDRNDSQGLRFSF